MKVYQCVITKDELASDSYPTKVVDDIVIELDGKMISISNAIDESLIGGNKSANPDEPAEEGAADSEERVINVVHSHKLQQTAFDKKSFQLWLKDYMKALLANLEKTDPARVPIFKEKVTNYVKNVVLPKFDEWNFYTGESMNPEGMVVLMNYREDGMTPYFVLFKDGVKEVKY